MNVMRDNVSDEDCRTSETDGVVVGVGVIDSVGDNDVDGLRVMEFDGSTVVLGRLRLRDGV